MVVEDCVGPAKTGTWWPRCLCFNKPTRWFRCMIISEKHFSKHLVGDHWNTDSYLRRDPAYQDIYATDITYFRCLTGLANDYRRWAAVYSCAGCTRRPCKAGSMNEGSGPGKDGGAPGRAQALSTGPSHYSALLPVAMTKCKPSIARLSILRN